MLALLNTFGWPIMAVMFGLCLGSLLNVVIHRLPLMLRQQDERDWMEYARQFQPSGAFHAEFKSARFNLFLPRSHCIRCKNVIAWYDNIPLLSWLLLRGRCRHCQTSISWRYPSVEIAIMLVSFLLACYFPLGGKWIFTLIFFSLLMTLAIIDYQHQLLPDNLTYPLLWLGLIWHCFYQRDFLPEAIIGAIAGYMTLWLIYWG